MTVCSRKGCGLEVDKGGLCFAHVSAAIADALAEVAIKRGALVVTSGGVSVQMHPARVEADPALLKAEPPAEPEPPKSLREMEAQADGDSINGVPLTPENERLMYAHVEGEVPTEYPTE